MITCGKCGTSFKPSRGNQRRCLPCKEQTKREKFAYLERYRLERLYGTTPEAVAAMRDEQDGKCYICHKVAPLVIDHHHSTKTLRKMLCNKCNHHVGLLETTDRATVLAILRYVRRWGGGKCPVERVNYNTYTT